MAKQLTQQFAPGKVIITGEHSVVYGYPALTTSLQIGTTVTLSTTPFPELASEVTTPSRYFFRQDGQIFPHNPVLASVLLIFQQYSKSVLDQPLWLEVATQLPVGAGLGSSSALAAATFKALAEIAGSSLPENILGDLVWKVEQARYTLASPIDAFTVSRPGVWQFSKQEGWESFPVSGVLPQLAQMLLINSGTPIESTAEMVSHVGAFIAGNAPAKQVLKELGSLVNEYLLALQQGQPLDQLIRHNHRLLIELPIVSPSTLDMIAAIEQNGGAAKITGAGGIQAGSGMILAYHSDVSQLVQLCTQRNWSYLSLT